MWFMLGAVVGFLVRRPGIAVVEQVRATSAIHVVSDTIHKVTHRLNQYADDLSEKTESKQ